MTVGECVHPDWVTAAKCAFRGIVTAAEMLCEFQPKLDTDSRATWTVIPSEAGHRFHGNLDSCLL